MGTGARIVIRVALRGGISLPLRSSTGFHFGSHVDILQRDSRDSEEGESAGREVGRIFRIKARNGISTSLLEGRLGKSRDSMVGAAGKVDSGGSKGIITDSKPA
jgi:hypothetical protein